MNHRESEKIDKFLDLTRESKKLCHMMVKLIVVDAPGTVPKGLEKRLDELAERSKQNKKYFDAPGTVSKGLEKTLEELEERSTPPAPSPKKKSTILLRMSTILFGNLKIPVKDHQLAGVGKRRKEWE